MNINQAPAKPTPAAYDDVFEIASDAVAGLRLSEADHDDRRTLSVLEFVESAIAGEDLWRWSDETQHVVEMVMLWEEEIADSSPGLLGHLDSLVALAVEIGLVRESFYWKDINAELAAIGTGAGVPSTGSVGLDAWFVVYGESKLAGLA